MNHFVGDLPINIAPSPVVAQAEAILSTEVEPVLHQELETGRLHDVVLGRYFFVSKLLDSPHLRAEDEEVVGGDSVAPAGLGLASPGQQGEGGHA